MNNALTIIIDIVLILISIVLIIAVLMQQGQRQGLGAIGGGAETFFGKNKAKGYEAKMQKITKIGAAVFIVLAIVATVLVSHQSDAADTGVLDDAVYTEEELEHDHDGDGIPDHDVEEHEDGSADGATAEPATDATVDSEPTDAATAEPEPTADAAAEPDAAAATEPAEGE